MNHIHFIFYISLVFTLVTFVFVLNLPTIFSSIILILFLTLFSQLYFLWHNTLATASFTPFSCCFSFPYDTKITGVNKIRLSKLPFICRINNDLTQAFSDLHYLLHHCETSPNCWNNKLVALHASSEILFFFPRLG